MNILFMTLYRIDDINNKGIYEDLLREFIKNNHHVYIVSPTERRFNKETHVKTFDNCKLLMVKTGNIQKTNFIEKGISTVLLESQYISAIKHYFNDVKFDLILYSTPPITLAGAVKYIKKRDNAKTYLLLKYIFPQNAVDIGVMKTSGLKGLLYKYFRNKEKEQMRLKYGIPLDKKVFVYGGNLGKPQGIPFLIECLKTQKENSEVFFLIVGDGTEYYKLLDFVNNEKQENVKLMSRLPKEDYDRMIAACDIGMFFRSSFYNTKFSE